MSYDILLFLHVVGAAVLLGTDAGIVVLADTVFTATAAIAQPVTGYLLARTAGWPVFEGWVGLSLALYVLVGLFRLPVVAMQVRLRDLASAASADGAPLPHGYRRLYRIWIACGVPAFAAVLSIIWLMLTKPVL